MRRLLRIGIVTPAVLLLLTGCATRDWVRDLLGQKETRIDQRIAGVEGRVGEQAQRAEGMGSRLSGLETGLGETREAARGARVRADEAYGRAEQASGRAEAAFGRAGEVDSRLTRLWSNRHARDLVETIHIQFGFDRWDLSDGAQSVLVALIKELRQNPRLTVELEGYTDSIGPREYNVQLSHRRVEAVRRYLVEKGIELPRIHSIGLGPLPDNGKREEQEKNRRVTLRLMVPKE
jgi:outer membrane protein OmpA-like peptidoglycan-associated protein